MFAPLAFTLLTLAGGRARQLDQTGAARFPQTFQAQVIGKPALLAEVKGAVGRAIFQQFKAVPGATWTYRIETPLRSLYPGSQERVKVMVDVQAAGYVQAYGAAYVDVKNQGSLMGPDQFLWFCNHPENLKNAGPLYANQLKAGVPVRVLYHHICYNTDPLYMRMELQNPSDQAASVMIVAGDGDPNTNPVMAGLEAAAGFLKARVHSSGEILTIPPHFSQTIAFRRMVLGTTMSGLCSIELMSGGPATLNLRADSISSAAAQRDIQTALMDPKPWHTLAPEAMQDVKEGDLSDNSLAYISPYEEVPVTVVAGGKGSDTLIGVEGIPKVGGGRHLNGNYGVLYQYKITLSNPTAASRKFVFQYRANLGYTAGLFLIDGKEYPVRPLQKGQSRVFYTKTIPAGSKVEVDMYCVPISGGIYPASVFIGS